MLKHQLLKLNKITFSFLISRFLALWHLITSSPLKGWTSGRSKNFALWIFFSFFFSFWDFCFYWRVTVWKKTGKMRKVWHASEVLSQNLLWNFALVRHIITPLLSHKDRQRDSNALHNSLTLIYTQQRKKDSVHPSDLIWKMRDIMDIKLTFSRFCIISDMWKNCTASHQSIF